jgi:4-hydroxy-3-methylbut-2-enyl diphosphate reductase
MYVSNVEMGSSMIRVKRAASYGFCAGVRTTDLKLRQFADSGGRGAILGQIVHNERVVAEMERRGLPTVSRIDDVSESTVIFSPHGVPPSFHEHALQRGLQTLDTTCTFVRDIHEEARDALAAACHLVFVGDPGHREVIGYTHDLDPAVYHIVSDMADARSVDWSRYPSIRVFFQTTLNAEDFEEVVRHIERTNPSTSRSDTICYATKENQDAARRLAEDPEVEVVLVVGGTASANSRHLWEIASRAVPCHLIQGPDDIRPEWLAGVRCAGLTAGASTPDSLIEEVQEYLEAFEEEVRP